MATGRDLQKPCAEGARFLNREERRSVQRYYRAIAREEQKRENRKKIREIAKEMALGLVFASVLFWMFFLADDGSRAQLPEQRWYAENSDYYFTSREDYRSYLAEKAAWEAQEDLQP